MGGVEVGWDKRSTVPTKGREKAWWDLAVFVPLLLLHGNEVDIPIRTASNHPAVNDKQA